VYFQLYQNMLTLYEGQYKLFGDPEVMPVKVIWDYTYYWGVMCQLFFQNRLTDIVTMSRMQNQLANVQALNIAMQKFLRQWGEISEKKNPVQMLDQASLPWFAELNRGLRDNLSVEEFGARMKANLTQLDQLAKEIVAHARRDYSEIDISDIARLLKLDDDYAAPALSTQCMLFSKAA
jgi:biopolymer transport protein ExbB/TolQ